MLVLSRKKNESIVIDNDITLTVVEIRGNRVRLGLDAPVGCPIHRQEVFEAIHGKPEYSRIPPSKKVNFQKLAKEIAEEVNKPHGFAAKELTDMMEHVIRICKKTQD